MTICICDISALELYRSSGRLLPNVSSFPRTMKDDSLAAANYCDIQSDLARFGAMGKPPHLLVRRNAKRAGFDGVAVHSRKASLPPRALVKITPEVWVVSPEYLFLELAHRVTFVRRESRSKSDELALCKMMLIALGCELCGTYLLDSLDPKGFFNREKPLAARSKIAAMIEQCSGMRGAALAREALPFVMQGAHSPMETALALLLTLPRTLGGMGFPRTVMNGEAATSEGAKRVDLLWPQVGVGLEYKGRKYHAVNQAQKDDRRENKLAGSGVTLLNVWYEDVASPLLFEALVDDIARACGIRVRVRGKRHALLQAMLRAVVFSPEFSFKKSKK